MKVKTREALKRGFVNAFGTLGYMFCSLQFLMAVVAYYSLIEPLMDSAKPSPDKIIIVSQGVVETSPSITMIFMSIVIAIFMIALSVYIFLKIPAMVARAGSKAVSQVAESTAPLVLKARHKKVTKKRRQIMTPKLILMLKIILIATPLVLAYCSQFLEEQSLDFSVTMSVSIWLASFSAVAFAVQYLLAKVLNIRTMVLI